jgi:putative membrane protein
MRAVLSFLVRWALSALVLMGSVAFVFPDNPSNTLGQAALISVILSVAWYITLARFLWFLLLPWLLYVCIWLATIMGAYNLGFLQALVVAVALSVLSWLVEKMIGVKTFRRE